MASLEHAPRSALSASFEDRNPKAKPEGLLHPFLKTFISIDITDLEMLS